MKTGTTYWITGLAGAGKTTTGRKLYEYIRKKKPNVIILDGDILRVVNSVKDYSAEARKTSAFQDSRWCKMLNEQGIDVVICVMNMYEEVREWNRKNIENYCEIYLKVPIEELIRRDQKQLYSRALRNEIDNVMGINMEYEEPKHPNLIINCFGENSPEKVLDVIIDKFGI